MIVAYEVLNEDTLPILEQLERLHLLRRVPENGANAGVNSAQAMYRPSSPVANPPSLEQHLQAWANQAHLSAEQKKARLQLIPQLIQHYKKPKKNLLELSGSIPKDAAEQLLLHIEQLRNEWD